MVEVIMAAVTTTETMGVAMTMAELPAIPQGLLQAETVTVADLRPNARIALITTATAL
jgi:hypothetical protein